MSYTVQNAGVFVETVSGTSHSTNITISGNAGRRLVVAIMKEVSDATSDITALTFNGTSFFANSRVSKTHSLNASMVGELWDYAIPDGTGAGSYALAFTTVGSSAAFTMYWYEVTGLASAAPEATTSAETEAATLAISGTLSCTTGAFVVASNLNASGTPTHTWSGGTVTERTESNETGYTTSVADGESSSTASKTVTCTQSGADGRQILIAASYAIQSGPTINTQPTAVTTVLAGPVSNNPATFSVSATTSGGSLVYDWELETSVGGGSYSNLADGNGATWTGQTSASCSATLTATTLSGRRVRCNVTDDNGTTTTDAVALTIYAGTTIAQPAATDGSGQATAVLTTDVADTANGQLKLITFTSGSTVIRTTARKTA